MRWDVLLGVVFLSVLLGGCTQPIAYDQHYALDPEFVLNAAGFDSDVYAQRLFNDSKNANLWGAGDSFLILARLQNKIEYYEFACNYFANHGLTTDEQKAIHFETRASLNCNNKRSEYLEAAASLWEQNDVYWRADLLRGILTNTTDLQFDTKQVESALEPIKEESIILGTTKVTIKEGDKVVTQVDRVYRDWLGVQMLQSPWEGDILVTFSERLSYNESELRSDVGWHEGGRMRDLKDNLNIEPTTAVGTIVARKEDKWYAPDEAGVFSFEVPFDKLSYPTTRFLTNDIAMIVDTHGVNMLVEQAIRSNADAVLSDCDHVDKTKAAIHLSKNDIPVICFPDRFAYRALGHNADLVSSPVWQFNQETNEMVYGGKELILQRNEKVIVTDADLGKVYAIWYYTTPALYLTELSKSFPLNLIEATVDDFNQLEIVFQKAEQENANLVATRVFTMDDRKKAADWLKKDQNNKMLVFHTTMYPAGILLMQEFPNQVFSADLNPTPLE